VKTSDQIGELVTALAIAQAKFQTIGKDKRAEVRSEKGAFAYKYADLASAIDATRPALTENGLAVMQPTRQENGMVVVTTVLAHKTGQWISEEMSWPAGNDTRARGSAVTYARRHGYLSIIGAAAQDDDDAAAAEGDRPQRRQPQGRRETPNAEAARTVSQKVQQVKSPATPGARMADLRTRLAAMHVPAANHFEVVAEFVGHLVDSKTELTADDWSRADAGIIQARDAGETLGRAHTNAGQAEH
jgi:hypothetical protein